MSDSDEGNEGSVDLVPVLPPAFSEVVNDSELILKIEACFQLVSYH